MPKKSEIKKVLVIGSGPIVIGQAAEFDYAGAQACRVLKDAGVNVVLCNSNPATIMTDKALADEIYLEPLTLESIKRIIAKERPKTINHTDAEHPDNTNAVRNPKKACDNKYA